MVASGVVGVQLDGASIFLFGSAPVPVVVLGDHRQGGVRFREPFIELEGAQRGVPRLRYELGWRRSAVATEQSVGFSQAGKGLRVGRVFASRLLKILDRLP